LLGVVRDDDLVPGLRGLLEELKILCTAPPWDIDDMLNVM
jgi:hypothetical protein